MSVGFIQDDLDLKLLVLYIMNRTVGPITLLQLFEIALCDAGVDYFSLTQVVEHMVATGQLSKEDSWYSITEKGCRNSQICENSLPYSVRMHCDENIIKVNDALRREEQIQSTVVENEDGTSSLHLVINDMETPLLRVELFAPNAAQANLWAQSFQADPGAFYLAITKFLAQGEGKHETE